MKVRSYCSFHLRFGLDILRHVLLIYQHILFRGGGGISVGPESKLLNNITAYRFSLGVHRPVSNYISTASCITHHTYSIELLCPTMNTSPLALKMYGKRVLQERLDDEALPIAQGYRFAMIASFSIAH